MPRPAGKGKLAQLCASSVSYEPVLLLNPDIRALVDRIRATGNLHRKLGRQELVSTAAASGLGLVASDLCFCDISSGITIQMENLVPSISPVGIKRY